MLYEALVREPLRFAAWTGGDPEISHDLALVALRVASAQCPSGRFMRTQCERLYAPRNIAPVTVAGIEFRNRVILGAGLVKDPRTLPILEAQGFAAVELGTYTWEAQCGNPRPRIRPFGFGNKVPPRIRVLRKHGALLNRLGFPNAVDAEGVAQIFRHARMPTRGMKVGISIGPSKSAVGKTAATGDPTWVITDILAAIEVLLPFADYLVFNPASPNTEGLRNLLEAKWFVPIMIAIRKRLNELKEGGHGKHRPLFVKVPPPPDLAESSLNLIATTCTRDKSRAEGLIIGNTTVDRSFAPELKGVQGGISGAPLHEVILWPISHVAKHWPQLAIMASGGLGCYPLGLPPPMQATRTIRAGASLLCVVNGYVSHGPAIIRELNDPFVER